MRYISNSHTTPIEKMLRLTKSIVTLSRNNGVINHNSNVNLGNKNPISRSKSQSSTFLEINNDNHHTKLRQDLLFDGKINQFNRSYSTNSNLILELSKISKKTSFTFISSQQSMFNPSRFPTISFSNYRTIMTSKNSFQSSSEKNDDELLKVENNSQEQETENNQLQQENEQQQQQQQQLNANNNDSSASAIQKSNKKQKKKKLSFADKEELKSKAYEEDGPLFKKPSPQEMEISKAYMNGQYHNAIKLYNALEEKSSYAINYLSSAYKKLVKKKKN